MLKFRELVQKGFNFFKKTSILPKHPKLQIPNEPEVLLQNLQSSNFVSVRNIPKTNTHFFIIHDPKTIIYFPDLRLVSTTIGR